MYQKLNLQYVACILLLAATPLIAAPYSDNGDGTVTDRRTNLVWQRCSMGQSSNATCSGTATTATWSGALTYCSGLSLAGRSWRLPSVKELPSIVDETGSTLAIDTAAFPGMVPSVYWSSTTYAPGVSNAWVVYFNFGSTFNNSPNTKTNNLYVRCVSSGP